MLFGVMCLARFHKFGSIVKEVHPRTYKLTLIIYILVSQKFCFGTPEVYESLVGNGCSIMRIFGLVGLKPYSLRKLH